MNAMSSGDGVTKPGVGLALGGGVVYSIAGVGVYRALVEANIPVVAVSGTSGGAIVGAAIAAGLPGWRLKQAALTMSWRDLVRFVPNKMGILNGAPTAHFVETVIGCRRFEDLKIPLTVVATDILTGQEVRFSSGPLGFAVHASCAVPGLFQPVPWEDKLLVDGGVVDNLPVAAVREEHHVGMVVAVDVLSLSDQRIGRLRTGAHVVLKAYHTMVKKIMESQDRQAALIVVPNVAGLSVLNFRDAVKLIECGEEAARALVPRLRTMLEKSLAGADPYACPI